MQRPGVRGEKRNVVAPRAIQPCSALGPNCESPELALARVFDPDLDVIAKTDLREPSVARWRIDLAGVNDQDWARVIHRHVDTTWAHAPRRGFNGGHCS